MPPHSVAPEYSPAVLPESPLVSNARLRQIYTLMLHSQSIQTRVSALVAEGRVAAELLPPIGEEATLASTAIELQEGDTLCTARRDWLPAMLKGVPLEKIVRWLLASPGGRPRALSDSAHGLLALPARPETQLAGVIETGVAHKRRKGSLAQAYIHNEIPAEAWREALRVAARRRLPVILICPTNPEQAKQRDFESLTLASQMPHIHVDGGDALAVYRVAQEATGRARRGLGPTLIECRISVPASTPNGALGAFAGMERHLAAKGVFSSEWKREIESAFLQELEAAIRAANRRTASPAESLS